MQTSLYIAALMYLITVPSIVPKDVVTHEKDHEAAFVLPVEVAPEEKKIELVPELLPVCGCESMGDPDAEPQQFNKDGTIKYYKGNYGMCQINQIHIPEASKMGMDIMTPEGNIQFANYLYSKKGYQPWNQWSGHCFNKKVYNKSQ